MEEGFFKREPKSTKGFQEESSSRRKKEGGLISMQESKMERRGREETQQRGLSTINLRELIKVPSVDQRSPFWYL